MITSFLDQSAGHNVISLIETEPEEERIKFVAISEEQCDNNSEC